MPQFATVLDRGLQRPFSLKLGVRGAHMAVSLPWPQTSLTGKNSLDNRMSVPGPICRARASSRVRRSCRHFHAQTCGPRWDSAHACLSRLLGFHAIIPTHSVESAPMLRRAGFKPGRIILRLAHYCSRHRLFGGQRHVTTFQKMLALLLVRH